MAHSIQMCRGRTAVINDSDLLIIVGFALKITQRQPLSGEFQNLMTEWQKQVQYYGPGVIDLKLEQAEQSPELAEKLRELLEAVSSHVSQYHEVITAHYLNKLLSIPGVEFHDYRIDLIKEPLLKLQSLIRGN